MIVFYLIASRLRQYAARFAFVDRVISLCVFAIVFLMGLRMGANREITSGLRTIGVQALLVTVLTIAGSMLGAFFVRKLLRIDRYAFPINSSGNHRADFAAKQAFDASGTRTSVIIFLMVVIGMLCGHFLIPRVTDDLSAFEAASADWIVYALCFMLVFVGFSMGLGGKLKVMLRGASVGVLLVPLFSLLGTMLGGLAYSFLSPLSLREDLAISAGFGWYSLAPGILSGAGYEVASAVAFLHNVLREVLGIILLPLAAQHVGCIEAVTISGTAGMDVCLPIVERSCTPPTMAYSFLCGVTSCIACAVLVPLIVGV